MFRKRHYDERLGWHESTVSRRLFARISSPDSLHVRFASPYYPATVDEALTVRWYTNDDFKIHYREVHPENAWRWRSHRHPNPHNTRDHFHPPPTASTPGDDASWPTDHRSVLRLVLDEVEERIAALWDE